MKNNLQDYDPRHRLTGAVVLILLAIILLPMLLSRDQGDETVEAEAVVMEVTKEGNKVFVSRIAPVAPAASTESKKPQEKVASTDVKKIDKNDGADEASSALFKPMSHTTA
ncbi:MAG: hypothetical protein KAJ95_06390, partial [Gammaproteobacteria bacterium]|nr:hypothetical protein [Gammaproteobacteria bacterium]